MSEMTIVTYGGVEVLHSIFTGIKMLFGKDGAFLYISSLAATIGALYVIVRAYFSQNIDIFKSYFIPVLFFIVLFLNVKTDVKIEDRLAIQGENLGPVYKEVDQVPLLIGYVAKVTSSLGYKITRAVETVMHTPDSSAYSKVGMIFGAESAIDMNEIHIKDAQTDSNLKKFCRTCVLYDLGLGLYSINDLKNSDNLLQFLKENTSKARMMHYIPTKSKDENSSDSEVNSSKGSLITCSKAINKIAENLSIEGKEVKHQARKEIFKRLPIYLHALSTVGKKNEELIQQSLVMSVMMDENASAAFASKRAALQQKSTFQAVGSQAGKSLVWMRIVFEALIYSSAIFVIPLAFLPEGVKYVKNWMFLAIWIQLWPPFYTILQYIMSITASASAKTYLVGNILPFTIYSTTGLEEIYANTSALAGYLSLSIPFLSYSILQGGVGSLVHLAGSIISPVQSAGASAGAEAASANYSFGNQSMDTLAFSNATGFQHNMAPSLTHGFIRENNGRREVTYLEDGMINKDNLSQNTRSLSSDNSLSTTLHNQYQNAESAHNTISQNYTESLSNVQRTGESFNQQFSNDRNFNLSESSREAYDASESLGWLTNKVESFGHTHGLSSSESWDVVIGAGIGGSGAHFSKRYVSDEGWQEAQNLSQSEDFKMHFQRSRDYAQSHTKSDSLSEGERYILDYSASIDNLTSSSEQFSNSYDQLNQISQAKSFYENASINERQSWDQRFNDFLVEETGSVSNALSVLEDPYSKMMDKYTDKFWEINSSEVIGSISSIGLEGFVDPKASFEERVMPIASDEINTSHIPKNVTDFQNDRVKSEVNDKVEIEREYASKADEKINGFQSTNQIENQEFIREVDQNASWSVWKGIYNLGESFAQEMGQYMVHWDDSGSLFEDD